MAQLLKPARLAQVSKGQSNDYEHEPKRRILVIGRQALRLTYHFDSAHLNILIQNESKEGERFVLKVPKTQARRVIHKYCQDDVSKLGDYLVFKPSSHSFALDFERKRRLEKQQSEYMKTSPAKLLRSGESLPSLSRQGWPSKQKPSLEIRTDSCGDLFRRIEALHQRMSLLNLRWGARATDR